MVNVTIYCIHGSYGYRHTKDNFEFLLDVSVQQWPEPGPNWSTLRTSKKEIAFPTPMCPSSCQSRSVASGDSFFNRNRSTDWHILRAISWIPGNFGDALYDIALWRGAVSILVFQPVWNWNPERFLIVGKHCNSLQYYWSHCEISGCSRKNPTLRLASQRWYLERHPRETSRCHLPSRPGSDPAPDGSGRLRFRGQGIGWFGYN